MTPKASIIILDFFKSKRVLENVEGIMRQKTDFPFEVIIVDNSCHPENAAKLEALKKYPNVQIHINKKNVGYIRGNNQGVKLSQGEYLLIVNPDILWPHKDTLRKLVDFMEKNQKIGIGGPRQINDTDNKVAMTVRAFPKLPLQIARRTFLRRLPFIRKWVAYDEMRHLDYTKTQSVDWLQSSFWITRRNLWEKWGGLNEEYFIFMSDPDLCFRCWSDGYQVMYFADTEVLADGERCSAGGLWALLKKWTLRQHLKEAFHYWVRHMFKKNPRYK